MTIKLMHLFASNTKRTAAKLRAETSGAEDAIYIYGVIGDDWYGGITAEDFAKALNEISGDTVRLFIDSPGGDVFAAAAMGAALDRSGKKVIAHIDGLAASAASKLIMHADEIIIADGAFVMIHNAWTLSYGNRHDFRRQADVLEKIDNSLVDIYQKRTGKDADTIRNWMDVETWFNADEAVAEGFADRKAEKGGDTQARVWDLTAYDHVPKALIEPPAADPEFPQPDRAAMERRVALLLSTAA